MNNRMSFYQFNENNIIGYCNLKFILILKEINY